VKLAPKNKIAFSDGLEAKAKLGEKSGKKCQVLNSS
jgi:hypothetical protein